MIGSLSSYSPFQRMDATQTGSASQTRRTEDPPKPPASDIASSLFSSADTDGSGAISSSELTSWVDSLDDDTRNALLSLQEQATSSTSSSGDGTTTTTEATSGSIAATLISAIDSDGDGSIGESELTDYVSSNAPPPPPPPPGGPDGRFAASQSSTGSTSASTASFSDIDTDGDGSITQSEYEAWQSTRTASSDSSTTSTTDTSSTSDTSSVDYAAMLTQMLLRNYIQSMNSAASTASTTLSTSVDTAA